jgi:hypothetical protein
MNKGEKSYNTLAGLQFQTGLQKVRLALSIPAVHSIFPRVKNYYLSNLQSF